MRRRQQPEEQFLVNDSMHPRGLDRRVMWANSYEALPPSLGTLWNTVMPQASHSFLSPVYAII